MQIELATPSRSSQFMALVGWLVLSFAAAALGAVASMDAGAFYRELQKPSWAPPAGGSRVAAASPNRRM